MLKKIIPFTLLAVSSIANAGGYLGVGLGQSSADILPIDFGPGVYSSVTDTDTAVKFFGGFELNRNFAVEIGYTYLGEMGVDYSDGIYNDFERAETSAAYFAAVGSIPLGGVSLFGKVGFASWNMDYSWSDDFGEYWSESTSGVDPMFGVGMQFNVTNAVSLRAEYERFMDIGDQDTIGQSDYDVLSISGMLWF